MPRTPKAQLPDCTKRFTKLKTDYTVDKLFGKSYLELLNRSPGFYGKTSSTSTAPPDVDNAQSSFYGLSTGSLFSNNSFVPTISIPDESSSDFKVYGGSTYRMDADVESLKLPLQSNYNTTKQFLPLKRTQGRRAEECKN